MLTPAPSLTSNRTRRRTCHFDDYRLHENIQRNENSHGHHQIRHAWMVVTAGEQIHEAHNLQIE
jgi:hypothetical protein